MRKHSFCFYKKIIFKFSSALALFLTYACSREIAVFNPMAYAPETPYAAWTPLKKSTLVSSKYCDMLLPENFAEDKLSLAELIDIALQNNPDTKITWAEARAQAAKYGQSLSGYFPEITGIGTYTRQRETFSLSGDVHQPYLLTTITPELSVTYTLFDFGQRRYSSESARQTLFYADWTHNQEIQTIIQLVMDDYYDYLFQKQQLIAYEADLENATATLDATEQQFQFGVSALGDIAQAKTSYLQKKINVLTQKKNVETAFAKLANDVGLPANIDFTVQDLPRKIFVDAILESVDALISTAQRQRQDLFAAKADILSKEADVKYAKSLRYPVFEGSYDLGKNYYNHDEKEDYHWTLIFKVSIPLFRGMYYQNGIRYAKANLAKSTAELLQKELNIIEEVTVSHYDVQVAADTLKFSEEYLAAAEEEFKIALSNYKQGVNTILDVLSAQSSLADARSKLASAKKDWYTSLASLAYSTGALCTTPSQRTQLAEF